MGESPLREGPSVVTDVGWEGPIPKLAHSRPKLGWAVGNIAWLGKGPGLAGSHALTSPTPVNSTVETEGMAGVEFRSVDTEANPCGSTGLVRSWVRRSARDPHNGVRRAVPGRS